MEKKYLIVNICGPEQKKRLEDYLWIVLNKEMHFKLTYKNYYAILYISEDLSKISSINATSAALAPRTHKFNVFVMKYSYKIKLDKSVSPIF